MDDKAKVLLVDDEPAITDNLVPLLERSGFLPHVAGDGEAALQEVSTFVPDLIRRSRQLGRTSRPRGTAHRYCGQRPSFDPMSITGVSVFLLLFDAQNLNHSATPKVPLPFENIAFYFACAL